MNLIFFGFTNCPDVCPVILGSLAAGLTKLTDEDRDQVDVYFVTSDPERDTNAALERYLKRFDPTFVGLRGDLADISEVGESLGIYVDKGERLPSGGYDPNSHGTYVVAMQRDGSAPAFWGMDTTPSQFAGDIETMLGR